jgi:inner membrane protein
METTQSMPKPQVPQPPRQNRYILKTLLIGGLVFMLFIPTLFIRSLVQERKGLLEEVKNEVSSKWSRAQDIGGPMLIVPYIERTSAPGEKESYSKKLAYILPDDLNISGNIASEIRYRSIYEIAVYNADLQVKGRFDGMPFQKLGIYPSQILWNEVQLIIGISDFRGINEQLTLTWNGKTSDMNSGIIYNDVFANGLGTGVALDTADFATVYNFSFPLKIKGSEGISFVPVGKTTTVNLHSEWKNPEFSGNFLPVERTVDETGFTALWKVLHLNREFPQYWKDQSYSLSASSFGVNLLQPLDSYAQTIRTVKYAMLVILLTFAIYFFVEVFQKKIVHAIQYALVGVALCVFYLLVLSISEYIPFLYAYLIAAAATVGLISAYTGSVFRSLKTGVIFGLFLGMLYLFIYMLIQMQEGALLIGSIGLFIILSVIMYLSRKIDWSGQGKQA